MKSRKMERIETVQNDNIRSQKNSASAKRSTEGHQQKRGLRRSFSGSSIDMRFVTVRGADREAIPCHSAQVMPLAEPPIKQKRRKDGARSKTSGSTSSDVHQKNEILYLMEKEQKTPHPIYFKKTKHREFAINWIIEAYNGDDPAVVQTAAWYLDRVMRICSQSTWKLPIAIMSCLWIAKKTYGRECSAQEMLQSTDSNFNAKHLCTMERWILKLLDFPQKPVVPQEFLCKSVLCCDDAKSTELLTCATFVYMNSFVMRLDMCGEFPSVVAVAAISLSLLLLNKRSAEKRLRDSFLYKAAMAKGNVVDVSMRQVTALRIFFSRQSQFTAAKTYLREHPDLLEVLNRQLNVVNGTLGDAVIRGFLAL